MNRDHLPRPTGAAAGNHTAPRKHAPARQCRHPTGRLQRDRSIAADLQAQVRRSPHAQCGTLLRSAFRCTPEQHNLHTQAAQPFGQTVASDRRPFRQDRLDEQPNASGGAPFEQPAASHGLPRQAPRTDRRFLAARRFGRRTAHRLGRHNPPDGYSKRPSRARPAAASNSRAVEAKASRRLVTSVARGSESSAIQTDSTPPSVAARRAERSSNSAKSPS